MVLSSCLLAGRVRRSCLEVDEVDAEGARKSPIMCHMTRCELCHMTRYYVSHDSL